MLQRPPHEAEGTLPCKAPSLAFIGNYLPVTNRQFSCAAKGCFKRVRIFISDHARMTIMPWTFAHPAAVLPFRKVFPRRLSFCALVIGSMSPDFPFYFGSFATSREAHTLWGLFAICLPSGLVLIEIIRVLHRPIVDVLPSPHRQRLLSLAPLRSVWNPSGFFWASIALLVGGFTHLVWDSFTHESGYSVLHWPILQKKIFLLGEKGFEVYEAIQVVSSVLGFGIVILAYRQWVRGRDIFQHVQPQADDRWRYQLLIAIASAAIVVAAPFAYFASVNSVAVHGRTPAVLFVIRLLIFSTTAFISLLCLASIAVARRTSQS